MVDIGGYAFARARSAPSGQLVFGDAFRVQRTGVKRLGPAMGRWIPEHSGFTEEPPSCRSNAQVDGMWWACHLFDRKVRIPGANPMDVMAGMKSPSRWPRFCRCFLELNSSGRIRINPVVSAGCLLAKRALNFLFSAYDWGAK